MGGIGDIIHCAHIPKLIKEYYSVDILDFETNYNGFHILDNNPYIDNLIFINHIFNNVLSIDNRIFIIQA